MKVIWHQTKREQPHIRPLVRLIEQLQESAIVGVLMKDFGPSISTVQDVVDDISN